MIKKFIIFVFILNYFFTPTHFLATTMKQHSDLIAQPAYAKWGRMAMEKTKEKYPTAQIIDYKHLGRIQGNKTSMERFKLWLNEGNKEFGVVVQIEFDTQTEKVIKISFHEVNK